MFNQTFQTTDIPVVLFLVLLEGLLSADNALVLAIMVRHLPPAQQHRALSLGLAMSFGFRFVAILLATQVIKLWWLQAIGALYLLYLPAKHFISVHSGGHEVKSKGGSFRQTVIALGIADVAFAIDSVLAAVATVKGTDKTWVVVMGALLGVILLRFAASYFLRLLEKYPSLDHLAYVLVGWVGIKLAFTSLHNLSRISDMLPWSVHEMTDTIFWLGMGTIIVIGSVAAVRSAKRARSALEEEEDFDRAAEQVEEIMPTVDLSE